MTSKFVVILLCFSAFLHSISCAWVNPPDDYEEGLVWGNDLTPQPTTEPPLRYKDPEDQTSDESEGNDSTTQPTPATTKPILSNKDPEIQTPDESEESLVWGSESTSQPTTTTTNPSLNNKEPANPCSPYKPLVPNFKVPGRRISEVKCYEYIWDLKERDTIQQRKKACKEMDKSTAANNHGLFQVVHILGGQQTILGEFPHMAAIGWAAVKTQWKFMCGGSIISSNFVLTAAHCSSAGRDTSLKDPAPKIVRLGTSSVIFAGTWFTDVNISKIIMHPKFKSPKQYFDIALFELAEQVIFTANIQPACLWTRPDATLNNGKAHIAGWGVTKATDTTTSPNLLAAQVDIINSTICDALLRPSCNRNWCGIQDHQMCAGKLKGGVDACQGDSGGPLGVKIPLPIKTQGSLHYILGVTSFGIGCGLPDLPGVYTRVSSFIDWIESIVWPGL